MVEADRAECKAALGGLGGILEEKGDHGESCRADCSVGGALLGLADAVVQDDLTVPGQLMKLGLTQRVNGDGSGWSLGRPEVSPGSPTPALLLGGLRVCSRIDSAASPHNHNNL